VTSRSRHPRAALAAALVAAVASAWPASARAGEAAPVIPWQDPAPFARPFLQLPFDVPEPIPPGGVEVALGTLYGNSIVRAHRRNLDVDVSVESAQPFAFLRYGLSPGVELEAAIPGVIDYPGFLARPIKWVESFFGPVNPLRLGPPPREARFRVLRPDGTGTEWSGTRGSAGDLWVGMKASIRDQRGLAPTLSWRAAVKAPTAAPPFGSGSVELGAGILSAWTMRRTSVRATVDLTVPSGSFTSAELATRPYLSAQVGVGQRLATWASLLVQGSVHNSPLANTGVYAIEGQSWYLLAGAAIEPSRQTAVKLALVENVLHASRGADITALAEFSWRR
jgi:hypothetical protein